MARKTASEIIRAHMARIGKKGGEKTGPSKARDPEKMSEAAKKRWAKKKDEQTPTD